jgi:RNA polymerase sigma factor (sigma-70 family)
MSSEPDHTDRLDRLLEEHLPRLRAFVRLRTNQAIRARESCSDLVQSVCREVLQEQARFEFQGEAAFRNWLYTAALRKIVSRDRHWHAQRRDVGREQSPASDSGVGRDILDAYATVTTPSMLVVRKESEAAFEAAFDTLSDEHREIVTLNKLVGLSHQEIAEQLGKSEEACRQLLRRALVKLEIALEKHSRES